MITQPTYSPFGGLEAEYRDREKSRIGVLPVPYDLTSTWKKGADRGPAALLAASTEVELYDIATKSEVYRHGIYTAPPVQFDGPPDELATRVEEQIAGMLDRSQFPVVLGGEHSVSIGAINAAAKKYDDLTVLQIDAHGDTRESYHGSTHNHACVMARARDVASIVQVGIRAIDASETERLEPDRVFFAHEIMRDQSKRWIDRVLDLLTEHVYVTIDLDAFDPSLLPATGTPEPGGLGWYDVDDLLKRVTAERRVVGFDVVELLPAPGQHASEFIAAKLVYRFLSLVFANNQRSV